MAGSGPVCHAKTLHILTETFRDANQYTTAGLWQYRVFPRRLCGASTPSQRRRSATHGQGKAYHANRRQSTPHLALCGRWRYRTPAHPHERPSHGAAHAARTMLCSSESAAVPPASLGHLGRPLHWADRQDAGLTAADVYRLKLQSGPSAPLPENSGRPPSPPAHLRRLCRSTPDRLRLTGRSTKTRCLCHHYRSRGFALGKRTTPTSTHAVNADRRRLWMTVDATHRAHTARRHHRSVSSSEKFARPPWTFAALSRGSWPCFRRQRSGFLPKARPAQKIQLTPAGARRATVRQKAQGLLGAGDQTCGRRIAWRSFRGRC